jgi:sugar lactone lactonase YvrE
MDSEQFDSLTARLSRAVNRRQGLGALFAVGLSASFQAEITQAKRKKHKKPCKAPRERCGGKCLAIQNDDRNCGACGNRCSRTEICRNGQCEVILPPVDCPVGECCEDNQICNGDGRCRDGQCQPLPTCLPVDGRAGPEDPVQCCSSNTNCFSDPEVGLVCECLPGDAGDTCYRNNDCRSGRCVGYQCLACSGGTVECNGQCVSLESDSNCGACGHACARSEFCQNQTCKPRFEVDTVWPGLGSSSVYVENDQTMFITDFGGNCVRQYSPSGSLQHTYGVCGTAGSDNQHLHFPTSVLPSGQRVFVADSYNNRVQIFARNGGWQGQLASGPGSGNYQVEDPHDITVDRDGNYYVADTRNHRVQKFSSNGTYLWTFGSGPGTGDGLLTSPIACVVDRSGNVYVADYHNDYIQQFDNAGRFVQSFGSHGSDPGQLNGPNDLALASNGDVFVPDFFNARVAQFTSNGAFVGNLTDPRFEGPTGIFIDNQDRIYVADYDWDGVIRFVLKAPRPS